MAKKLSKFLLGAAVIGGAAAAAYMYLQKKGSVSVTPESIDEDYDDFSKDTVECPTRNYVSLTKDTEEVVSECCCEECPTEECLTEECLTEECLTEECPITECTSEDYVEAPVVPDAVEEFFDEEKIEE